MSNQKQQPQKQTQKRELDKEQVRAAASRMASDLFSQFNK